MTEVDGPETSSMQVIPEDDILDSQTIESRKVCCTFRNNKILRDIAGIGGNILEWYDFAVFGYFSDILGEVFFPEQEDNAAMIESFAVFGIAFICRPIGGLLLGYIGDVYGRKTALQTSIFLMAFPTFLLGCLPSYDQVGNLAIVLLIMVRMLQGFSVGGQLVSSLVYTCENKPRSRWGFYGSFVLASANFGTLLGGIVAFYIRSSLNDDQLHEFGWRIPFLSGIIICMFGIYLRYFCDDDEVIHTNTSSAPSNPLAGAFALKNLRVLVSVSLVPMLWAGGFYITFVWMAIFMEKIVEPPVPQAFAVNSSSLFFSVCTLLPIAGSLSDSFGRKRMMFIGCIFLACVCPGLVIFISEGVSSAVTNNRSVNAFFAQVIMGTFLSCFAGPMCAWLVESFPAHIRLTSVAVGYNISAIIGGMAPSLTTYLTDKYGTRSPGFVITALAIISMIGLAIAPRLELETEVVEEQQPEIELKDMHTKVVDTSRNDETVLGISFEEFEENQRLGANNSSSYFPSSGEEESSLETIEKNLRQIIKKTRVNKDDDSFISYGDNSDGMSFGTSDFDDEDEGDKII